MTVPEEEEEIKPQYTCDKCGSKNYTRKFERHFRYIHNGPFMPPIGREDLGAQLFISCNDCNNQMFPTDEDIERFFSYKHGTVFYADDRVSTE